MYAFKARRDSEETQNLERRGTSGLGLKGTMEGIEESY
jgi:hypothetical protein